MCKFSSICCDKIPGNFPDHYLIVLGGLDSVYDDTREIKFWRIRDQECLNGVGVVKSPFSNF